MMGLIINGLDVYSAESRKTEIGKLVEGFIDKNLEDLSPVMYQLLEELAREVDEEVNELEDKLAESENDYADLNDRYDELRGELSDMEEKADAFEAENDELKQTIAAYLGEGEF